LELELDYHTIATYDIIFEGTLQKRTTPEDPPALGFPGNAGLFHFHVERVWKGDEQIKDIAIWATGSLDGYIPYAPNQKYLVYAELENGILVARPDLCGPDHIFSEKTAKKHLTEYNQIIQNTPTSGLELGLQIDKGEKAILNITAKSGNWNTILNPQKSKGAVSFLVYDQSEDPITPKKKRTTLSYIQSFSLEEGQSESFEFDSLSYFMEDQVYFYRLKKGKWYRVIARYHPHTDSAQSYTSNAVFFQYNPAPKAEEY